MPLCQLFLPFFVQISSSERVPHPFGGGQGEAYSTLEKVTPESGRKNNIPVVQTVSPG